MKKIRVFYFVCFFLLASFYTVPSLAQDAAQSVENVKLEEPVEFTTEDLEKVKTLIESHFRTRISDAEFAMFGKPTESNLMLFHKIRENQQEDPFYSEPHIEYIIFNMEERLGLHKPGIKTEAVVEEVEKNEEDSLAIKVDIKSTKPDKEK